MIRFALGAAVLGCGYVCPSDDACPSTGRADAASVAVENAARYLSRTSVGGEEAWFVRRGAAALGGEFEPWVQAMYVAPDRDGRIAKLGARAFAPLPVADRPRRAEPRTGPISLDDRKRGYKSFELAAKCTQLDDEGSKELIRVLSRRGHSYFAAAQLWGIATARELECLSDARFIRLRDDAGARVVAELEADAAPHDLTAERMAALQFAGFGDVIPTAHIDALVEAQHPVGAWMDPHFDGGPYARPTVTHMTTVAFFVLAHRRGSE